MSTLSTVVDRVKAFLTDLPSVRKEIVAALTAAATMVGVMETVTHASGGSVAILATISGVITGAVTFLSNPEVIQVIQDIASALSPVKASRKS